MARRLHGFTLVELLVVITIIVVLLALLTPAMDQAIYQAELTVCGARHKALGGGVSAYAMDHARAYPIRTFGDNVLGNPNPYAAPRAIATPEIDGYDLRAVVAGYVQPAMYVDPLSPKVDMSFEATGGEAGLVFGSYDMWFSFGYRYGRAMRRMGDRMLHAATAAETPQPFRVLVSCYDDLIELSGSPRAYNSHPDDPQIMSNTFYWQAAPAPTLVTTGCTQCLLTDTRWTTTLTWQRGTVDQNVTFTDLSVTRYADKPWNAAVVDSRFDKVGRWAYESAPASRYIPLSNQ
jgi:prepilin-type N-terminal cleavage/methylation domain-containing protein